MVKAQAYQLWPATAPAVSYNIARAKDLSISSVLALKTDSITWEQIGKKLKYNFPKSPDSSVTVKFKGDTGIRSISGKDYGTVAKEANEKAQKDMAILEDNVSKEFGLATAQIEEYERQGFNIHEIRNAARLAKKANVTIDKILEERKDGKDWPTIIQTYEG